MDSKARDVAVLTQKIEDLKRTKYKLEANLKTEENELVRLANSIKEISPDAPLDDMEQLDAYVKTLEETIERETGEINEAIRNATSNN